jgi:hypothetical protein
MSQSSIFLRVTPRPFSMRPNPIVLPDLLDGIAPHHGRLELASRYFPLEQHVDFGIGSILGGLSDVPRSKTRNCSPSSLAA